MCDLIKDGFEESSVMNSDHLLTQVNKTFTVEPVGDNLSSQGYYYKLDDGMFNFTKEELLTIPFERTQTSVTVTVEGTGGGTFTSTLALVYPVSSINSVVLSSFENSITANLDVTNIEEGWISGLGNMSDNNTYGTSGSQFVLTETFNEIENGDWRYEIFGTDNVLYMSEILPLNYIPPPPPDTRKPTINFSDNWTSGITTILEGSLPSPFFSDNDDVTYTITYDEVFNVDITRLYEYTYFVIDGSGNSESVMRQYQAYASPTFNVAYDYDKMTALNGPDNHVQPSRSAF